MKEHRAKLMADDFGLLESIKWQEDRLWIFDALDRKAYSLTLDGDRMFVNQTTNPCPGDPVRFEQLPVPACTESTAFPADESIDRAGGIAVSRSGDSLFKAEMWSHRLRVFDRAPDGTLSNGRTFSDLPGREPDGICLDAEGAVWVACFNTGEAIRVLAGGQITDRVQCARHVMACELGGNDGKTLYCVAYNGTMDDLDEGRRLAAIYAHRVTVPGAAFARMAAFAD